MKESASFLGLAQALERVRGTTSKNEKVRLLADYLAGLKPDDARVAARIASGRASERGSKEEAQVGYSTLLDVLRDVTGATQERVSRVYMRHGDLGEVAEELLGVKMEQPLFSEPLTLEDLDEAFARLRSLKGKGSSAAR